MSTIRYCGQIRVRVTVTWLRSPLLRQVTTSRLYRCTLRVVESDGGYGRFMSIVDPKAISIAERWAHPATIDFVARAALRQSQAAGWRGFREAAWVEEPEAAHQIAFPGVLDVRRPAAWQGRSQPRGEPVCRVHDKDDVVPGRICGRPLPCRDHGLSGGKA